MEETKNRVDYGRVLKESVEKKEVVSLRVAYSLCTFMYMDTSSTTLLYLRCVVGSRGRL